MPLAVENLTPESNPEAIRTAISASVQQCMNEPTPAGTEVDNKQKWCAAQSYSIARDRTGKPLGGER